MAFADPAMITPRRAPAARTAERAATSRFAAAPSIWVQAGLLVAVALVPTLLAYALDPRLLNGISVWIKPLKFEASVALHLLTLAILASLVARRVRDGWLLRGFAWASAVAGLFEIGYIAFQAARGRASHFNIDTALEASMYQAMGVGAVILILPALVVGWYVFRAPREDVGAGLRLGAGLGLILGFVGTLVIGGYLGSQTSHWIGGVASDADGLPVTGWSTTGGDARVPHFLATHMMQGLPLVGWLADRTGWPPARRRLAVYVAAGLWVAAAVATFVQALAGQPLIAL